MSNNSIINKNNKIVDCVCSNCSIYGHMYSNCHLPINSYGIICFRYMKGKIQYLMIRRKDSFSYIDFIRGKYSIFNLEQLQYIIDEITIGEKEKLLTHNYETLRNLLWGSNYVPSIHKTEENISQRKFETIKNGIRVSNFGNFSSLSSSSSSSSLITTLDDQVITLKKIVENSKTNYIETEWEFPKGRKNNNETDLNCALREFSEETGYSNNLLNVVDNVLPFEEIFIGSNYKSYKHKYFLAYMEKNIDFLDNFQKSEVSKLEWKTYEECIKCLRPSNKEKRKIIDCVHFLISNYTLSNKIILD